MSLICHLWKANSVSEQTPNAQMEKYVKLTDFQKFEENPFMDAMIQDMAVRNKKQYLRSDNGNKSMVVVHDDTQTPLAQTGFFKIEEVDQSQFVKIFVNGIAEQKDLTTQGRNLMFYFMTIMRPGSDTVRVRIDEALKFLDYKAKRSYFMGVANLLERKIIARTKYDDEFYINPLIMFNGDRIVSAKIYVKKKSEAAKRLANEAQLDIFDFMPNPTFQATKNQHKRLTDQQETPENQENAE